MEHYTGPLDFIGLPGYEITPEGIKRLKTGRILSPKERNHVRPPGSKNSYRVKFSHIQYLADHGLHFQTPLGVSPNDGRIFSREAAQPFPTTGEHYYGDLDHIGLPDYELLVEGLYHKKKRSLQRFERKSREFFVFYEGDLIPISHNKIRYCADHNLPISAVRGNHICCKKDGALMLTSDYMAQITKDYHDKRRNEKVSPDEQRKRINEVILESQMKLEALDTGDYSKLFEYVAQLEPHVYRYLRSKSNFVRPCKEKAKAIWSACYEEMVIRLRNGSLSHISITSEMFRMVTNKLWRLHNKRKTQRDIEDIEYRLHNEDDEMPYQYD